MKKCYGERRYWGDNIYNQKIDKRKLIIYLLFSDDNTNQENLIGTIFLKPNGKLSGLAIFKKYRGKGYSSMLIRKTMCDYSHLFVEVDRHNALIKKLLLELGFTKVKEENNIQDLLKYEKLGFLDSEADYTPYYHGHDKTNIDRQRIFIMFEYNDLDA
ncbi:MAG: hypothetical protein AAF849_00670 [Bacteroidota bacterium]